MNLQIAPELVIAFLLVMSRLIAAFSVAPPFGGALMPLRVRIALSASIAIAVAPLYTDDVPTGGVVAIGSSVVYQVVVGVFFGYVVQLLLSAPMVAGLIVDTLAGLSAAGLFDPFANVSATAAARMNQFLATVVLLGLEGHLLVVRGVLRSYEAAPLGGFELRALPSILGDGVGQLLLAAVEIALPLLVALLLTEVMLALAARAAPRLNVMVVGFAVKSLVFMASFALTVPLLINAVATLLDRSVRWALIGSGG
ncbi:MAG: flagellar biosynthetic protein FliR [Actinomycetota bacterium]